MKTKKEIGYDKRIRFGWCDDLDMDPQRITETRVSKTDHPVAIVPLPFASKEWRRKFDKHLKGIVWPDL